MLYSFGYNYCNRFKNFFKIYSVFYEVLFFDFQVEFELDYMKWVKEGGNIYRDFISQLIKEDDEDWQKLEEDLGGEGFIDEVIFQMSRRKYRYLQFKYIFMKEEDTNVKGIFIDKFRDMYDNVDISRLFNAIKLSIFIKFKFVLGLTTEDLVEDRIFCQFVSVFERYRRYYDYIF